MEKTKYPYVVLRAMAAVYVQRPVRFVDEPVEPVNKVEIVIHCPGAFKRVDQLTAEARRLLIEDVQGRVKTGGYRQCIVFGPREALFVEADGTVKESEQPPGGGVVLKDDVVTEDGTSIMK